MVSTHLPHSSGPMAQENLANYNRDPRAIGIVGWSWWPSRCWSIFSNRRDNSSRLFRIVSSCVVNVYVAFSCNSAADRLTILILPLRAIFYGDDASPLSIILRERRGDGV